MSVKNPPKDPCPDKGNIVRCGYLKKMKTSKKKWFVLRAETPESSARLEYYDSEKKFNSGQTAKRSIPLKTCFNINRRNDTKSKHVIALFTKDDCFCVVLDSEEELDSWLKALLSLQHGDDTTDGETPKPIFEHVWQVTLMHRGVGTLNMRGPYSLCLTDKNLKFIKKDGTDADTINMNMSCVRSCGNLKQYVLLEIGRSSVLGAGELWMDTYDENIAINVHTTIYHAMITNNKNIAGETLEPKSRIRSSSATEASKPNNMFKKQQTKPHILAQDYSSSSSNAPQTNPVVPTTSSSSQNPIAGGVTWSGNICHQRTQSLPLAPTTNAQPNPTTDQNTNITSNLLRIKRSSKCSSGRERCDSMPTRPRTTSEGNPINVWHAAKSLLAPRFHSKEISHSPPSDSPVSPPSVGCSTESSGSNYSLDENDVMCNEIESLGGRFNHSLTPDEAIAEEDSPDSPVGTHSSYVPMAPPSSDDGYVDMSPRGRHISPTTSMNSVTSGTTNSDIRFSEYTLEKVTSYFAPSEDDEARPLRAYSVGSRPENSKCKVPGELENRENSRVRAFSVGSKTKRGPSRVLPPHNSHSGNKSSSAPILSTGRMHSSHGSIGPMDDLMELDFSRSNSTSISNTSNSGYMDMKPGPPINTTPSGYVEMKPGTGDNKGPVEVSPYVDMSGSSPSKPPYDPYNTFVDVTRLVNTRTSDYMDMDREYSVVPSQPATSPIYPWPAPNSPHYHDMSYNNAGNYSSRRSDRNSSFSSQLSSSPNYLLSPKCNEGWSDSHCSDCSMYHQPSTPEGYVEMSFGNNKHQRQSSLDSSQMRQSPKTNDDYTNMSLGKKRSTVKESQPITITNNAVRNACSCSGGSFQVGRKYSTGTPPKMHLALSGYNSPYSSLQRQRSRKNSRRDSKDSSSSSVTTPSSSSTIFPFSPSSPVRPVTTPGGYKVPTSNNKTNNEDYAIMDMEKIQKKEDTSEYVNYSPAPANNKKTSNKNDDNKSDYAIMKPGFIAEKVHKYLWSNRTSPKPGDTLQDLNNSTDNIIREVDVEEACEPQINNDYVTMDLSDKRSCSGSLESNKSDSRPGSTSSDVCSSSSSTLVGSRPDSVNSDRVPNNDTGLLHYARLDLAQNEESGSRSPRINKSPCDQNQAQDDSTTFVYAEIDFVKSDGMKHQLNSARIKH